MTDPTTPAAVQTLLPPNAMPRELSIEGADAAVEDLNVTRIITVRDVANTPSVYLPYLAWERSVKVWDSAWPDATKRAVINAAPEVNRFMGSAYAVKTALAALGVTATVTEWWQTSPQGVPYSFHVKALAGLQLYGDGPLLDNRLIRVVFSTVLHTKPLSRAFDLVVAADMPATLGLAPVTLATTKVAVLMQPRNARTLAAILGVAPVAIAATKVAVLMQPVNSRTLSTMLGMAPVTLGRVRVAVAMTL